MKFLLVNAPQPRDVRPISPLLKTDEEMVCPMCLEFGPPTLEVRIISVKKRTGEKAQLYIRRSLVDDLGIDVL